MENLTNVLDEFALKLKCVKELSEIRFVHAGRDEYAERPVVDFLVACGVSKEEYTRDKEYKGTMEFTLYAPQGEGKRALTLLANKLACGLKEADTKGYLEKITVADSTFDSNLTVWKQVVSAVYFPVAEKIETEQKYYESVYIDDQLYTQVTSFEVVTECSAYERRELLAGAVEEYTAPKSKYTIKITMDEADLRTGAFANKDVNVYRVNKDTTYDDCRFVKAESETQGRQHLTFVCRRIHKGAQVSV